MAVAVVLLLLLHSQSDRLTNAFIPSIFAQVLLVSDPSSQNCFWTCLVLEFIFAEHFSKKKRGGQGIRHDDGTPTPSRMGLPRSGWSSAHLSVWRLLENGPKNQLYISGVITPLIGVKWPPVTHLNGYSYIEAGYNSIYNDRLGAHFIHQWWFLTWFMWNISWNPPSEFLSWSFMIHWIFIKNLIFVWFFTPVRNPEIPATTLTQLISMTQLGNPPSQYCTRAFPWPETSETSLPWVESS